ncbi:MAG: lipid carrier--UDP-N-acetylgalactosaminyltransferase [Bacteroidetes bacterium]|nr:MAG: lipid carrier--UDP-N-acetylgalactosaminyltransferase [Bacteroidota bacterium]
MNLQAGNLGSLNWKHPVKVWEDEALLKKAPRSLRYSFQKRTLDIVFSLGISLTLLSWLLPLLALLIRLESKGSPFFAQVRTGKDGKSFTCYKLRTMRINALSDTKQATDGDERITRMGKFLRLSSLDELPQLFNVLLGDMSLVGPRPHMLYHTNYYEPLIPSYKLRHLVKPGLTGLAQVKGLRGPTTHVSDMERRVHADLYYISNRNILLDIRIIGETAKEVWRALFR